MRASSERLEGRRLKKTNGLHRPGVRNGGYDINPYWHVVGEALSSEVPFPMTPVHRDIQAQFNNADNLVINGTMAPSAALQEAGRIAQNILDAYWAERMRRSGR